jgi:hypothetical protein
MTERPFNATNYKHDNLNYQLNDLHQAMEYNSLGQPVLRTTISSTPTATDAFGRLRVSQPFTLFDSFHRFQDNGKISELRSGTATSVHDPNSSTILLTIGTALGDKVYRESNKVFAYQPGKALSILETFVMNPAKTGLRQRYGYFDVNNGIFLQVENNEVSFCIRSTSQTGTAQIVEKATQNNWNIDPLNGTGTSTKILDLTVAQIMFIDIEWLGVGTVRVGFVIDGEFVPVHTFHHANIVNNTTTYMGTACLPIRCEIENIAVTASSSSLRVICTTVLSEGGYELRGRPNSVGHPLATPYTMSSGNTLYPLLSIRLKSNRFGAIVVPKNFSIGVSASSTYRYQLLAGAVTSGGTWNSAGTDSSVEYNLTATGITNGRILETGFIISSNQASSSPALEQYPFAFQLERNTFNSTAYEFVLAMEHKGNNLTGYASINWEEIT